MSFSVQIDKLIFLHREHTVTELLRTFSLEEGRYDEFVKMLHPAGNADTSSVEPPIEH